MNESQTEMKRDVRVYNGIRKKNTIQVYGLKAVSLVIKRCRLK